MATRRMILKYEVESPIWWKLTHRQRYLYWGLMLYADDDGIIPKYHIATKIILPKDNVSNVEIDQDLSELEVYGFIYNYHSDKDAYIIIQRWWDKQNIKPKLYKQSNYPTPNKHYIIKPPIISTSPNRPSFYINCEVTSDKKRKDENNLENNRPVHIREESPMSKTQLSPADNVPF